MTDIEAAERTARMRAILFYLMAASLLLSAVLSVGNTDDPGMIRLALWLLMVVLTALNLTTVGGWFKSRDLVALLNDEVTRDHRRTALAVGFWAALASSFALTLVTSNHPLAAADTTRVTITAALMAALIAFATLELRAAR